VILGFTKLCAEQNPNMFALANQNLLSYHFSMVVNSYDSKENGWHCLLKWGGTMLSGDGGLVCLVDKRGFNTFNIEVLNPLTRQRRKLPSLSSLSQIQPCMVQLVMDQNSKGYKVLVVARPYKDRESEVEGEAVAMIFSSATGEWSQPNIFSDLIFGYHWKYSSRCKTFGHGAYDCTSTTLLELDEGSSRFSTRNSVQVKDRLFVFQKNCDEQYLLTEYQAQSRQPHFFQLKVHKCHELDEVSRNQRDDETLELETRIFGCQDFLVVYAYRDRTHLILHELTLLFDLSTSQWKVISKIPKWIPDNFRASMGHMFELRWDIVP